MTEPAAPDVPANAETPGWMREVNYEHGLNLTPLLEHLRVPLLVSTYQAGKLVVVEARTGKPEFSFHSFERAMGVAVGPNRLAVKAPRKTQPIRSGFKPHGRR
jgi:hypothetical protein